MAKNTIERKQYPIGKLITSGQVKVSKNAWITYEERGNPNGPVVVYNHGGPGGSSHPESSQWFDPSYYRIITYDQRGTGKSIPSVRDKTVSADTFKDLTIDDMVEDLEKLRAHLGIDQWLVFGGSWGSTLSLYYSEQKPEHVAGLIVYGIYLNQRAEMDEYFNIKFMRERFPELGELAMRILLDYAASKSMNIDPFDAASFVESYYKLCVLQDDPVAQYIWTAYEDFNNEPTIESLLKLLERPTKETLDPAYRSIAIFESTMFRYAIAGFNVLDENKLRHLKDINVHIIQGLGDTEAPPTYAKKLVAALSKIKSDLHVKFINGGHDGQSSAEMIDALIESTDSFKHQQPNKKLSASYARYFKEKMLDHLPKEQVTNTSEQVKVLRR